MKYDRFQQKAINYIDKGHSVIVSAPTGAGKTMIAEHTIRKCLDSGTRVIYTAPIKALSNQKYRDFRILYGDRTGIITGDVSINPSAQLLIMTTEIFRNKVLTRDPDLADYSWIIFDEIHYIDDYERGTVWEESLIFLPEHMRLLALSATIPNIAEFSEWIRTIHGIKIKTVVEENRPVPLHLFYQCQNRFYDDIKKVKGSMGGKKRFYYRRGRRYIKRRHYKPNRIDSLLKHLETTDKLPCIYFAFSRKRCQYLAEELNNFDFLNTHEKAEISSMFNDLCEKYDLTGEESARQMEPLIKRGIAFHHAGMLPTLKETVEQLFTSKLIRVIFTTETFALGINMPARTVIFDELRKFYGRFHANLKTRDFYQMAGRAGRRGIDIEGFVYSRINPNFITHEEILKIVEGDPEKVYSRFNASYATIINLYKRLGNELFDIYPLSFHHYQQKRRKRERALGAMRSKLDVLEQLGYIRTDTGTLTEKGEFAGKLYGYELGLTELYYNGLLDGLSDKELAVLALAAVFEPRKGTKVPKYSKVLRRMMKDTGSIIKNIHRIERKNGFKKGITKEYYFHLSPCISAWMDGEDFGDSLRFTDADEGEIIRYFRMGLQVLREILDTPASKDIKQKVRQAIHKIDRDIVDAESQLRE